MLRPRTNSAAGPLIAISVGLLSVVIAGVCAFVFLLGSQGRSSRPSTYSDPRPGSNPAAAEPTGGPLCQKAARCCRAVSPRNSGCDMMVNLPSSQCAAQAEQLESAAHAMKKRCD